MQVFLKERLLLPMVLRVILTQLLDSSDILQPDIFRAHHKMNLVLQTKFISVHLFSSIQFWEVFANKTNLTLLITGIELYK